MALSALIVKFSDLRKRSRPDACATAGPQEERKTMTVPQPRPRRRKPLDAGPFAPEIGSFRLHLAAEGKADKTVRTYTEAVQWFAAAHLIPRTGCTRWDQVSGHDVQRWLVHLLTRYSDAYASNQFRALQQFFRWLAEEEQLPGPDDPAARPQGDREAGAGVHQRRTIGAGQDLPGRSFAQRRRSPRSSRCSRRPASGPESWPGSATTRATPGAATSSCGAGRSWCAARAAGRGWSRSGTRPPGPWTGTSGPRSRHAQAHRPQLWLGVNNRGPMTANGIYQMIARRGRQCGVDAWTHRFRHHFSHTWLDRGGAEGDLMELNGWSSPQMLRLYGASARSARARRTYDRIMTDRP